MPGIKDARNNVGGAARPRRKVTEKRSLLVANGHFIRFVLRFVAVLKHVQSESSGPVFNNSLATQKIMQPCLKQQARPSQSTNIWQV